MGSYRSFVTPSTDHCVPVLLPVETSSVMHGMHPRTRDLVIEGLLRVLFIRGVADMDAGLCTAAYQRRVVLVRPGAGYTSCSSSFPACEMLRVFDTVIIVRGKGHCKGSLLGIQPWRWIVHVALPKSLIQC